MLQEPSSANMACYNMIQVTINFVENKNNLTTPQKIAPLLFTKHDSRGKVVYLNHKRNASEITMKQKSVGKGMLQESSSANMVPSTI